MRTRTDEVRDTLDWAAGAGNPRHNGSSPALPSQSQSRFWNLQPADLVEVVMVGTKVTERQAPDEEARAPRNAAISAGRSCIGIVDPHSMPPR